MSLIAEIATSSLVSLLSSFIFFLASFLYVWSVAKKSWKKWLKKEKKEIDTMAREIVPQGHTFVYDVSATKNKHKNKTKKRGNK